MPLPTDPTKFRHQWRSGGGHRGTTPLSEPLRTEDWRPGDPAHWSERSPSLRRKVWLIRIFGLLSLAANVFYLQYRARETIGVFDRSKHPVYLAYQIVFFLFEAISCSCVLFQILERWNASHRKAIDFCRIPNDMIAPGYFTHSSESNVRPEYSNYPSVGVYIPCYNEEAALVLETVVGALEMDYPRELLSVYLCDDGNDPEKESMIRQLRKEGGGRRDNVHYVTRPRHVHAKAGNLNHALERTDTHLVVTLDADFIARPNLLQRLLPYYFVYNPSTNVYDFNETLAVVQTPQHFRNLSPYDVDRYGQRAFTFTDDIMPAKDWFNASTMIGTTNLLSRKPLEEAGYYPHHSITEDTAMSMAFHSLGYRTYYVNESLATGLATESLWSHFGQRSRWLKGDFQILFSREHNPLVLKGLTLMQRLLYLKTPLSHVSYAINLWFELVGIVLLFGGPCPLDIQNLFRLMYHFSAMVLAANLLKMALCSGAPGLVKESVSQEAFESIFRYTTVRGIWDALVKGRKLTFKVTDKASVKKSSERSKSASALEMVEQQAVVDENTRLLKRYTTGSTTEASSYTASNNSATTSISELSSSSDTDSSKEEEEEVFFEAAHDEERRGGAFDADECYERALAFHRECEVTSVGDDSSKEDEFFEVYDEEEALVLLNDTATTATINNKCQATDENTDDELSQEEDIGERADPPRHTWSDTVKNLRRLWFSVLMSNALIASLVYGIVYPPVTTGTQLDVVDGVEGVRIYDDVFPLAMVYGYTVINILPHLYAVYLSFVPYLSVDWMLNDLKYGRCDQYAVHPETGELFVPESNIVWLGYAKTFTLTVAFGVTWYVACAGDDAPDFVPTGWFTPAL